MPFSGEPSMPNQMARSMAMATTMTGAVVLFMPTARPWMIVVAGPVSAASAMLFVGRFVYDV